MAMIKSSFEFWLFLGWNEGNGTEMDRMKGASIEFVIFQIQFQNLFQNF